MFNYCLICRTLNLIICCSFYCRAGNPIMISRFVKCNYGKLVAFEFWNCNEVCIALTDCFLLFVVMKKLLCCHLQRWWRYLHHPMRWWRYLHHLLVGDQNRNWVSVTLLGSKYSYFRTKVICDCKCVKIWNNVMFLAT